MGMKRLTIALPTSTVGHLESVQEMMESSSAVEAVRRSIMLTKTLLSMEEQGRKLILREPSGAEIQLVVR